MPREVIHLGIGQCGNQIGVKFWETIAQEHGLAPDGMYCGSDSIQLQKIDVYYHETNSGCFVPRALLVDMENSVLNHITSRTYGQMFRPENMISDHKGSANNFNQGCYSDEAKALAERVLDMLRVEVERTECMQGFTYSHSSGGGTGSGLTYGIHEIAQDLLATSFGGCFFYTVFPSQKISNTVLEPYNTVLTLDKQQDVENVVCFDNESLYNICFNTVGLKCPTFGDMNRLVSMILAGTTAPFRFPGQINTDMNKLSYSLRADAFLHFYMPSFAPLTSLRNQRYKQITIPELVRQMVDEKNCMFESKPEEKDIEALGNDMTKVQGKCCAYAAMFRGNVTTESVDEALSYLNGEQLLETNLRTTLGYEKRSNFILSKVTDFQYYWKDNPRPTFSTITDYAPPGLPMSCTFLNNSSVVKFKFLKYIREAVKMYSVHSYAHWYNEFLINTPEKKDLGSVLNNMCVRISEFGIKDYSEFPAIVEEEHIMSEMVKKD